MDEAGERDRLVALLRSLGATDAELDQALASGNGAAIAIELALRNGRAPLSTSDAATVVGAHETEFLRFWRALGLTPPPGDLPRIPADLVDAFPLITSVTKEYLGEDTALGLARVIGSATARIAEAVVDAFRMELEVPDLAAGASYADVVNRYVELTRASLPGLETFVAAMLRAHLVRVASGAWTPDDEQLATRRDLFVGFVDLVGYTALSRTLTPAQLATLLGRFEDAVADVVTAGGGRLVKLIGDGALFVTDDVHSGCAVANALSRRLRGSDQLPPARVGADCGPVLSLYGDYFGDVVNRAARLVALADPATVVVSNTVADAAGSAYIFERLPAQALKGFQTPASPYRLLGPAG